MQVLAFRCSQHLKREIQAFVRYSDFKEKEFYRYGENDGYIGWKRCGNYYKIAVPFQAPNPNYDVKRNNIVNEELAVYTIHPRHIIIQSGMPIESKFEEVDFRDYDFGAKTDDHWINLDNKKVLIREDLNYANFSTGRIKLIKESIEIFGRTFEFYYVVENKEK